MIEILLQKFMNNLWICISIISVIAILIIAVIVCVAILIKLTMTKKKLIAQTDLLSAVGPIMEIAEKFDNYSGAEKKEYVITRVQQFAVENKLNYDSKTVSDKIEELINFSKKVNNKQGEEK